MNTERISEHSWYLTTAEGTEYCLWRDFLTSGEIGWSCESVAHHQYERWDSDYSVPGLTWRQAVKWAKGKIL